MGLATSGFLARIFRLSRFGHQSRLASPIVGCVRPCTIGQRPPSWVAFSASTGSWFSGMGIPSGLGGSWYPGAAGVGTVGAQAPVDDLCLFDCETVVIGRCQAGRL